MASPPTQSLANGHASPAAAAADLQTHVRTAPDPEVPLTSLQDDGLSKRPRDARLIHMVLSGLGVQSYQERVPLQLLDFAYRYTSSILSDSLRLSAEGYASQSQHERDRRRAGGEDGQNITVAALRQAIASRQGFAFQQALPKEFMLEQASARNRVALPKVERSYGVQLPPEKYCLTGVGWGLKEEWDSGEDESEEETAESNGVQAVTNGAGEDKVMGGMEGADDEDEEGGGNYEDIFGADGDGDAGMDDA